MLDRVILVLQLLLLLYTLLRIDVIRLELATQHTTQEKPRKLTIMLPRATSWIECAPVALTRHMALWRLVLQGRLDGAQTRRGYCRSAKLESGTQG